MSMGRVLLLAVCVAFLSGCAAKGRCHKVREYQKAEPGKEIAVPEGLAPLEQTDKIVVPEGERNQSSVPRKEKCPEFPPEYFRK